MIVLQATRYSLGIGTGRRGRVEASAHAASTAQILLRYWMDIH
jgi:hypothetical protein